MLGRSVKTGQTQNKNKVELGIWELVIKEKFCVKISGKKGTQF